MAENELANVEDFGVVEVKAKVGFDDVLDLRVDDFAEKLTKAMDEVDEDTKICHQQIAKLNERMTKSLCEVGFAQHVKKAKGLIAALTSFVETSEDNKRLFDVECSGGVVENEKLPPAVAMHITVVDKRSGARITRVATRPLVEEEVEIRKEVAGLHKAIEDNAEYRTKLDKAYAGIPLLKRKLKNEVVRAKLKAAGQEKLLDSVDGFKLPDLPRFRKK